MQQINGKSKDRKDVHVVYTRSTRIVPKTPNWIMELTHMLYATVKDEHIQILAKSSDIPPTEKSRFIS